MNFKESEMKNKRITLKLKIKNLRKEQAVAIVNMLQEMEKFGYRGHSAYIGFYADGDGDFHPQIQHNLHMSKEQLDRYSETTKVYENQRRTHSNEKSFPWTNSITLFDFDGLFGEFEDK